MIGMMIEWAMVMWIAFKSQHMVVLLGVLDSFKKVVP